MTLDRLFPANPYYDPEKCGLCLVASVDVDGEAYAYNLRVVWQDIATGVFLSASDSGGSCPDPFEGWKTLSSLEPLDIAVLEAERTSVVQREDYDRFLDRVWEAVMEASPAESARTSPTRTSPTSTVA